MSNALRIERAKNEFLETNIKELKLLHNKQVIIYEKLIKELYLIIDDLTPTITQSIDDTFEQEVAKRKSDTAKILSIVSKLA